MSVFKNLFNKGKKEEDKAKDEDPAQKITNRGKLLCEDPAALNELLKELCGQLATAPPYLQERVDLALGNVIGRHSSRMLSTVWTVLLQQLRELHEPKAQLRVLKHFSGVSSRIAVVQRPAAFTAFGNALMLLLGAPEVVGDRSFADTVASIVIAIGASASEEYCVSMMEKCVLGVLTWTRMDARRSAAAVAGSLLRFTRYAGTYSELLEKVKDKDPLGRALLVDAALPRLLEHATLLSMDPTQFPCVLHFKDYVGRWLQDLLNGEATSLETSVLSSVIKSYERLLEFTPDQQWETVGKQIVKDSIRLLTETPKLKKVLVCPLVKVLSFIRIAEPSPHSDAAGGEIRMDAEEMDDLLSTTEQTLKKYTQAEDPMARAEAWGAYSSVFIPSVRKRALGLASSSSPLHSPRARRSSVAATEDSPSPHQNQSGRRGSSFLRVSSSLARGTIVEKESIPVVLDLLQYFRDQHYKVFEERDNITCRALLAFIAKISPVVESVFSGDQRVGSLFGDLIAYLFRSHSDRGIKLNQTTVIQTALLDVLQSASARISNVYVLSYTLDCVQDSDIKVRTKGVQTLTALAERCPIEVEDLRRAQQYDAMSFLEGVSVASSSWKPEHEFSIGEALQWSQRNYSAILHHAHTTLVANGMVMDKKPASTVMAVCAIISEVNECINNKASATSIEGLDATASASNFRSYFTELNLEIANTLMDILLSPVAIPGDVLVVCTQTMAGCLESVEASVVLGDSSDGYSHKTLFSFAFGLLCICCRAIDPVAMPNVPMDPTLYLSHFVVGDALGKMVATMGQNAQSGSSDQFRELVDAILKLTGNLFVLGRNSNLFRAHMKLQVKMVLICCDVAAAVVPNRCMETVKKMFDVMFILEDFEVAANQAAGTSGGSKTPSLCSPLLARGTSASSKVNSSSFAGKSVTTEAVAGLLPGTQTADIQTFIKRVIPVLNRSLMYDLSLVGPTLFYLIEYFLAVDINALNGETLLYSALDPDRELFKRMHTICTDSAYYNKIVGAEVPRALTNVIALVVGSEYEESCFAKIKDTMTSAETFERILLLSSEAQEQWDADVFLQCSLPLASRTPKAASILSWGDASRWDPVRWSICNQSAHAFQQDPEACQAYASRLLRAAKEASQRADILVCSRILGVFQTLSAHSEAAELDTEKLLLEELDGGSRTDLYLLLCITILDLGKLLPTLVKEIFSEGQSSSRNNQSTLLLVQNTLTSLPQHHIEELGTVELPIPLQSSAEEEDDDDANTSHLQQISHQIVNLRTTVLQTFTCRWECKDWTKLLDVYQSITPLYTALIQVCWRALSKLPSTCALQEAFWVLLLAPANSGTPLFVSARNSGSVLESLPVGFETSQVVEALVFVAGAGLGLRNTLETKKAAKQVFTELGSTLTQNLLAVTPKEIPTGSSNPKLKMFFYWLRKQVGEESFSHITNTKPSSFTEVCNVLPYRGSMMMPLLSSGLLAGQAIDMKDIHRMSGHVKTSQEAKILVNLVVEDILKDKEEEATAQEMVDPEKCAEFKAQAATTLFALGRRCASAALNIQFTPTECRDFCIACNSILLGVQLIFEDELHCALRLAIMSILVGSSIDDLHWERILSGEELQHSLRSPTSTPLGRDYSAEEWGICKEPFVDLLFLCSMRQEQGKQLKATVVDPETAAAEKERAAAAAESSEIPDSVAAPKPTSTIEALCRYVASALLFSRHGHSSLDGSIFWHVVRCLPLKTVRVILADETLIYYTDPECIRFFCKLAQTIGLCRELLMELHARYTPLLVNFGQGGKDGDLDNDQQRALMWYTTCLLVQTTVSEERHTKAKVHYSMMDGLAMYADYPLAQMSLPSAQRVRNLIDQHLLPEFQKTYLFGQPTTKFWNSHTHAFVLPVRKRLHLEKSMSEKTFSSILHMYLHSASNCFAGADTVGTQTIADLFTSLQTVSWLNPPLFKHSPHNNSTIATTILQLLFTFYRTHFAAVIASASGNESSTLVAPGGSGFPTSSACLDFHDGHALCALMNTVVSLFSKGHELLPGAIDSTFLVEKMLVMDVFTNQAAHTAILVMAGASTRREVERLSRMFMQRLGTDIARFATAPLTMSACMMQSLRTAFTFIASGLEEPMVMKACEALWNCVVWKRGGGRRVQYYAHFLLQSIVHMQVISETQWHILRAIVTLPNSNEPKTAELSNFEKAIETFSAKAAFMQETLTKLTASAEDSGAGETQVAGSSSGQAGGDGGIDDFLEGNSAANRTYATTANLLHLTTLSAFTLRSKTAHSTDEEEGDMSRVDALDMLRQVAEEPTAVGEVFIQVVYTIVGQVLDSKDLLFVVLNRFNFSTSALVLFSAHLQKLVREPGAQLTMLMSQLSLFFDASARREQTQSESWWTVAALLCSLYSFVNEPEAAALSKCLCGRLNALPLEGVCWYVWTALRNGGRTKDTKLLLRSMEASLKNAKEAAEEPRLVTKTIRKWMDESMAANRSSTPTQESQITDAASEGSPIPKTPTEES